jgi:hypothetical protein
MRRENVTGGKYLLITHQAIFIRTVREVEITFHPKDSPITLKKIKMKIITINAPVTNSVFLI